MAAEAEIKRLKTGPHLPVGRRRQTDGIKSAAIWLLFVGALSLAIWYVTNDDSMMSMLLALAAISTFVLAVLIYFLSPSKSLSSDVSDAMALSGTLEIRKILSSLQIESKGIYIPSIDQDSVKIYLPVHDEHVKDMLASMNDTENKSFFLQEDGVAFALITPPGYGIFQCAKRNGAHFSEANLENEIGDAIEDNLELADKVEVQAEGNRVLVTMKNMVNNDLCNAVRKEDPAICCQIGCPVCSAVGCMIVNGTGKMACIDSVDVDENKLVVEFCLIGD